ncbi:MAG: low specificity L-threonine aldolase [Parvibaculaceae bacterium]
MPSDRLIDLYSDTKTKPTPAMRRFMMEAEVGDEQKGEDPTTSLLAERVADLLGKEAAVFLPSGTMCNQIALAVHCRPGDEVYLERGAHIINFEGGGPATLAGVVLNPIDGERGVFTADQLSRVIREESRYGPKPRLVCLEQTANLGGGRVWPMEAIASVMERARKSKLKGHLDGARLFNATVKSGHKPADYARHFDSLWIDFTKGLGAPVGAVLAGPKDFIHEAWQHKQRLGGAMRQSGIIAAACLYALDHHVERLAEDHANAQTLAKALSAIPGIRINPQHVETNIIFFDVADTGWRAADLVAAARGRGVVIGAYGSTTVRVLTHLDVNAADVERAAGVIGDLLSKPSRAAAE